MFAKINLNSIPKCNFYEISKRNILVVIFAIIRKIYNIQNIVLANYSKCTWFGDLKPSTSLGESAIILQTFSMSSWLTSAKLVHLG